MKNFRPLLFAVGFGLIFLGLAIYRMPDKDIATARTELRFSAAQQTVTLGKTFTIEIVGDPNGNAVIVVEPHIQYDPSVLRLVKIEKSSDYPQVLSTEQITDGIATITVGSSSISQPVRGVGVVAYLTFEPLKLQDNTVIDITDQSFVGGKVGTSTPTNQLAKRTGTRIAIIN